MAISRKRRWHISHSRRYINDLIKWAGTELHGDSSLSNEGRAVRCDIVDALEQGAYPIEIKDDVERLRQILEKMEEQRLSLMSQRFIGGLISRSHEYKVFQDWLNTLPDGIWKNYYINLTRKGEYYEIPI